MANEIKKTYGNPKTLEANGASTVDAGFSQADDANLTSTDTNDYPDAIFVLSCTFGTAPAANKIISLYAQPLDIDGTNDAPVPDANFKRDRIGSFTPDAVNTLQYLRLYAYDIPRNAAYYIENSAGQTISAGWTLKATPVTVVPGA